MLTRRDLIENFFRAGLLLSAGTLFPACSGVRREATRARTPAENGHVALTPVLWKILHYASLAPSGHNSQPWRVHLESPERLVIAVDPARRLPAVDPYQRELLLSLGAFVENLCLAAGAVGLAADTTVVARTPHAEAVVRIALHKDLPRDYPMARLERRRTVKHGHRSREIAAADVAALDRAADGGLTYFPRGSRHAACIREATVESFRIQTGRDTAQRELVRWLRLSDTAARRHRDGLTTEGMEISGLQGWFIRHFVAPESFLKPAYREKGVDMTAEIAGQGGGWLILASTGEAVADLIAAGRRFQRMALVARERNIALHPMTQALEEAHGRNLIAAEHGAAIHPQFILRAGYLDHYPAPVSLRRPVEEFVV